MEIAYYMPGAIIRGVNDGKVIGTAVVYYDGTAGTECTPYHDGTVERIAPGAFDKLIARGVDVYATRNHDPKEKIGRTPKTLKIMPHSKGIDIEWQPVSTTRGRDTLVEIENDIVRGMSFIALPGKSRFHTENGRRIKTIQEFDAWAEVSFVDNPYYTSAQIKRSMDSFDAEWEAFEKTQKLIREIENMKL